MSPPGLVDDHGRSDFGPFVLPTYPPDGMAAAPGLLPTYSVQYLSGAGGAQCCECWSMQPGSRAARHLGCGEGGEGRSHLGCAGGQIQPFRPSGCSSATLSIYSTVLNTAEPRRLGRGELTALLVNYRLRTYHYSYMHNPVYIMKP